MKRTAGMLMLVAAMGGCVTTESNHEGGPGCGCSARAPLTVPGVQGPYGQPVTVMRAGATMPESAPSGVVQAGGVCPDGKCMQVGYHSGKAVATGPGTPPGVVAGVNMLVGPPAAGIAVQRTSVRFLRPEGMKISWYVPSSDGRPTFSSAQLDTPGRYNFTQGAIYRLKLSHLPNRPNIVALYPTLEVAPATNKTGAFLAHSAVPVVFTDEDFDQVAAGNYLVKVIYLPDPQFQDVAAAGPDEVVSTRLDPGVDPVAEARRRGTVLLVIRMGNIDLEALNTPAMEAPNPYMMPPAPRMMPNQGKPMAMGPQGMGPHAMGPQGPIMGRPMVTTTPAPTTTPILTDRTPTMPPVESIPAPQAPQVTTLPAPLDAPPAVSGSQSSSGQDTGSFEKRPSLRRRLFSGSGDN
jgi:hypothetical protein